MRIGNGCGFWGDSLDAPIRLVRDGKLDVLTLEYLAELTMSILALQKQKDPHAGFAGDFLDVLERLAPDLKTQPKLKIVTNAGGMNPRACAEKAKAILSKHGLTRSVAIVEGDDLLADLDRLLASGHPLTNLDTGEPLAGIRSRVVSANAYLGARPIADALAAGAEIVITGRVADASLTVGPAMQAFGWNWNDWDRLSQATAAGHLIECGAQVTGGIWTNWKDAPNLAHVGYPFVDIEPDGSFVVGKSDGSGGVVNLETVREQLLYEVGDPAAYMTPDVVADFTSLKLDVTGAHRVRLSAGKGKPAPPSYKVSIAYRDGWASAGTLVLCGPDAVAKANAAGRMLLDRLAAIGMEPQRSNIEVIGSGVLTPGIASADPPEVMLRVAVHDERRAAVERFTKEFAPLVTSGPPGVTGYTSGRPAVREVFAYWPALLDRNVVLGRFELV
jgi:hypothetical protein